MQKNNKTGLIGIIITIIALTTLVILTNVDINNFSPVESIINKTVMPIQNGLTYLKNKLKRNDSFFSDINQLKDENQNLKVQIEDLKKQLNELEVIKAENKTLREYANLSDDYTKYPTIPADIIDKDFSNYNQIVIINVGKKHGVYSNMAVVAAGGIVGHVISSTDSTAKVQLIIDSASNISAITTISRDQFIIKGELGETRRLKGTYLSADSNLVLNDDVETSGLGGIYPKGLKVGKVVEVIEAQNITEKYVIIEPYVDFSKLETVLVIKE